jgi:hypothetical protein
MDTEEIAAELWDFIQSEEGDPYPQAKQAAHRHKRFQALYVEGTPQRVV